MSTLHEPAAPVTTPRVRGDLVIGPALRYRGTEVHYVKDPVTNWYYRVGAREHFLIGRLDGTRSPTEVEREYAVRFGRRLGPGGWRQLLSLLADRRLLAGQGEDPAERRRSIEARQAAERAHRTPLRRRVPLTDPYPLYQRLLPRLGLLFHPGFVLPGLAAAIAVTVSIALQLGPLFADARSSLLNPLLALPVIWGIAWLHENAHGLTCARYGGRPTETGFLWRFPLLIPYCKADDVLVLRSRWHRVYTAFAGVFVSLLSLVPFALAWSLLPAGHPVRGVLAATLLIGAFAGCLNLVPFLQLDGYFMLSHALRLADLRTDTYRYWLVWLRGRRHRDRAVPGYRRAEHWIYASYGLATALFVLALCGWLFTSWFLILDRAMPAALAAGLLAGEVVVVACAVWFWLRRRRRRAAAGPGSGPAGGPEGAT